MSLVIASQAEPIPGYRLIERLGGGGFGEVWKAEAPGGLHKAIKVIHGDLRSAEADTSRHAEQELRAIQRMQTIRHPYLLSLERYDIVEGRVLIVMELADCNLWDRFRQARLEGLPGIPRHELLRYMEEAAEVLDLMNNQYQLQHLDIKPQNLFLLHNHVKVADFGLVKDLEGVRASITGGVTPVYAAPETFDGVVTRFCDQYSLAIVYQELLTGIRPFAGANVQQLLVQHMQAAPNVSPLPIADRQAVARALAKKPEERFPTCLQFVRALYQASSDSIGGSIPGSSGTVGLRAETPVGTWQTAPPMPSYAPSAGVISAEPPPETPRTEPRFRREECPSKASMEVQLPIRVAPPEMKSDGVLLPTVIVGIGQFGLEVLRYFRREVAERHAAFERLPNLRLLFIDTDPETLHVAAGPQTSSSLVPGEVVPMRLNRASHYLKPRRNGRSLIEGWFDPQLLYKIPRNPVTLGIRSLGRLAFFDHYRTFVTRFQEELEACSHPDILSQADRNTRLGMRTNRPRVYVIAGLGGGTGSGMFIDVAYAVRHRMRMLGYSDPDVQALLFLPALERNNQRPYTISNTYAALRELYHFSMPETVFTASHEDKDGQIQDAAPPFKSIYIFPLSQPPKPNSTPVPDPAPRRVVDFLHRELLTPVGRLNDELRDQSAYATTPGVRVRTVGQSGIIWPRPLILAQTSRWLGEQLIGRWLNTDVNLLREHVKRWLEDRWAAEELGPESITTALQRACEKSLGQSPDSVFVSEAQPFVPKGWFSGSPDPTKLWQTLSRLQSLVGTPDDRAMQRQIGKLEQVLKDASEQIIREFSPKFARLAITLLEHPDYRLVGAEEAVLQLERQLDQQMHTYEPQATELAQTALEAFSMIHTMLTAEFSRRKPSATEIAENLRMFPKWRYQSLVLRQVCRIYLALKSQLSDQLREIRYCRERLEEVMQHLKSHRRTLKIPPEQLLLPPGCNSLDQAIQALQDSITPEDLRGLDKKFQKQLEQEYQALHSVCLSSVNMLGNLYSIVLEQARLFLSSRLGEVRITSMFFARHSEPGAVAQLLREAYQQAAPPFASAADSTVESCVLGIPDEENVQAFVDVMTQATGNSDVPLAGSIDEILIHRERSGLPLTALPHCGPLGKEAFQGASFAIQGSPHARIDILDWFDFDRHG